METTDFKINEYLSLKLQGSKTFIYVNGKEFRQCKYVLLNIPLDDGDQYSSINSIDEVIDNLDRSLEQQPELISPEVEFWAHCSNLQAWAEHNYNTDLLDSFLSFPLLKELTQAGELQAQGVLKEEIARRLMRGDISAVSHLNYQGYLDILTREELTSVLNSEDCLLFENIFSIFQNGNSDEFRDACRIYDSMGKYLYPSISKKLHQIIEKEDVEKLYTIFNYLMLDTLSNEDILLLFKPPINLLEKVLIILNKIHYKKIEIDLGLLSKRIENILGDKIGKILLDVIYNEKINYFVLWTLDLLKYLEDEDVNFLEYLIYK